MCTSSITRFHENPRLSSTPIHPEGPTYCGLKMCFGADSMSRDCSRAGVLSQSATRPSPWRLSANTANTRPLRALKLGEPCDSNSSASGNARHSSRTAWGMVLALSAIAELELVGVVALAEIEHQHGPEIDDLVRSGKVD